MHQIYGIAAIVGVGGFFLGYDVGIISGVLAMDGFADVFGTVAVPGAKAFLWLNLHADFIIPRRDFLTPLTYCLTASLW